MVRGVAKFGGGTGMTRPRSPQLLLSGACWLAAACVVGWSVTSDNSLVVLAALVGVVLFVVSWNHPRLGFVVWLLSLVTLPIWVSVNYVLNLPAYVIIGLIVASAAFARARIYLTPFDLYFAGFLALSFAAVPLAGSSAAFWIQILLRWGIPFLVARVLVSAVGLRFAVNALALTFGVIGGLAVIEFLFAWHPFVDWSFGSSEFDIWHSIQVRNGGDRSEWAFGHSIALGGSLAISIPFILRCSFSWTTRAVLLAAATAGIAVSASRGALIAAALSALICLLYVSSRRLVRAAALSFTLVSTVLFAPSIEPLLQTWAQGSSAEERTSFEYRNYLYSTYVSSIKLFGRSPVYDSGGYAPGGRQSFDSAIVYLGLGFGWLVLVFATLPLMVAALRVIFGRASTAEIAIVGQIPLFATVALITQYESVVFFVAGIAVQALILQRTAPDPQLEEVSPKTNSVRSGKHALSAVGGT